jgi:site-specific DNA-methyltransferase (adenine-specific)
LGWLKQHPKKTFAGMLTAHVTDQVEHPHLPLVPVAVVTHAGELETWDPIKPEWEPDVFEAALLNLKPEPKPVKVYHKSGSDEHGTPQALFDRLDDEFHFDLDVCATAPTEIWEPDPGEDTGSWMLDPGNAKCPIYFTKEDDGLSQQWFGRVWMNPPYTKGQVGVWIQKLLKELVVGRITLGVALTAARPDTAWFQVVASYANEIRFLKGRLTFEGQSNAAPFPSVVLVFDPTKKVQIVKFWDWQTGHAPVYWKTPGYTFVPGAAGQSGMALPSLKGLPSGPSTLALVK